MGHQYRDPASMEPCLFRHGKAMGPERGGRGPHRLQWSHVFSDMVRINTDNSVRAVWIASMEPCLFRHGKLGRAKAAPSAGSASMEPCLFRHGKVIIREMANEIIRSFNGAMSFQTW